MLSMPDEMSLAGDLANLFTGLKKLGLTDRAVGNDILRRFLLQTPEILGAWCVWEPDAFDGRDADFAGSAGHDPSGRFVPLWHRFGDKVQCEPNTNYDRPDSGQWYLKPSRCAREMVIDPYEYSLAGQPTFITTQAAPIFDGAKCVGAAGIDIAIASLCTDSPASLEHSLRRGHVLIGPAGEVRSLSGYARDLLRRCPDRPRPRSRSLPPTLQSSFDQWRAGRRLIRTRKFESHFPLGADRVLARFAACPHSDAAVLVLEIEGKESPPAGLPNLSHRQREVIHWLSEGKSNDDIAVILGASPHTIKHHVEHIFQRLGVENRYAAAARYREAQPPPASAGIRGSTYPL